MSAFLATLAVIAPIFLVIALMIFLNGLYVGAEFATVGARRTRISQMAANGDRMAQRLLPVLEDTHELDDYVAACQLGITISSLALGAYGQRVIAANLVDNFGLSAALAAGIVLAFLTLLQVILGELFPKSLAVQFPERMALAVIMPIRWSQFILRPLIWSFNGSGKLLLRLMGREDKSGHSQLYSSDEIEILVTESHEGGLLQDDERTMLRNAFRLKDLTARQVMVHRTRLITQSIDVGAKSLIDAALEAGFTRIPVYQESVDNIIGFVHLKDVFRIHTEGREDLREVLREVIYVPEALPVVELWEKLNLSRQYVAIVFDEYGGTEGMVTQEDLIEEIFGELQDEFDDENALVKVDKEGRIHLRADLLVADVNEYMKLGLPEDGADSIGGLVFSELGRRPKPGDEVLLGGVSFRVEAMDDLAIAELSVPKTTDIEIPTIGEWEVEHD